MNTQIGNRFQTNICDVHRTSESLGITSDKIADDQDTCSLKLQKLKRNRPRMLEFGQDLAFSDDQSREMPILPKTNASPVS